MGLKSFLGLVEMRTKLASMIPFILGTMYAVYRFERFNILNFFIMFLSLICFDMVTTALNNYFDFKRAKKKYGYNYESHNVIVRDKISEATVLTVIFVLFIAAVVLGVLLVFRTDITVLAIGMVSFGVGILYSFGPVPVSRTPLGELLSGLFMGFVIVFLSIYIHVYDQGMVTLRLESQVLSLQIRVVEVFYIFLYSIPSICGIANIMLANNICDIEDDIENRRYTLPVYIGRKNALLLFRGLYYSAFAALLLSGILRLVPLLCLAVLLALVPVNRNLSAFDKKQSKKETFALSVKNFVLISGNTALLFGVSLVLHFLASWIGL